MILVVNSDWRIVSDTEQWAVQKRNVVQKGKTKGQESWRPIAYFTRPDHAALWLAHRRVREMPYTVPAADGLELMGAALGDIVDEFKRMEWRDG